MVDYHLVRETLTSSVISDILDECDNRAPISTQYPIPFFIQP
jgi:hypothetical protein